MLDSVLSSAGYLTGRYTSPHLTCLEERFSIGGTPVSRETLIEEIKQFRDITENLLLTGDLISPPTFFEATTAIALSLFRRAAVQIAILEVGMGGRFDATNIVTPRAVAIPSIDFDHQQYLGTTIEDIAFEKAGVIKPGTVVVTGEKKLSALTVFRLKCQEEKSTLIEATKEIQSDVIFDKGISRLELETPACKYPQIKLKLRGRHQIINTIVAVRLLEELNNHGIAVSSDAICKGLEKTDWPGRLQLVQIPPNKELLLDAAHNVASAKAFADYVNEVWPGGIPLVFSSLRDKDITGIINALGSSVTYLACPPLKNSRSCEPNVILEMISKVRPELRAAISTSTKSAFLDACEHGDVVGVVGSAYLIGEIMVDLNLQQVKPQ